MCVLYPLAVALCFSGPSDIKMSGIDGPTLMINGLHIDENEGSPTVYQFMLTVVDYRGLNDTDVVTVMYSKGNRHYIHIYTYTHTQ